MAGASAAESGNEDDRTQALSPEPAGFDRLDQGRAYDGGKNWPSINRAEMVEHRWTARIGTARSGDQGLSSIPRLA